MTRAEFIKFYCDNSGIAEDQRTATGFQWGDGVDSVAIPCHCEEDDCRGWQMLTATHHSLEWQLSCLPDDECALYSAELADVLKATA